MKGFVFDLKLKCLCFRAKLTGTIEYVSGPPMPGALSLVVISQENGMLQFKLSPLPPGSAPDVKTQEVSTVIAGGDPIVWTVPVEQTELIDPRFEGEEDVAVQTSLVNIDKKGNRSPAHVQAFVLEDNQSPPEPGDIGLVVTGQT